MASASNFAQDRADFREWLQTAYGGEPLHSTEERFEFARGYVKETLANGSPQEQRASLLAGYLLADPLLRDAMFVEVAARLSWRDEPVSRQCAADAACPEAVVTRTRRAPWLWDRLRAALAALLAPQLQPRSGS